MRRSTAAAMTAAVLLGAGCSQSTAGDDPPARTETRTPSTAPSPDGPITAEDYRPELFADAATVDHRWYPLKPGTALSYRGSSLEDGERLHHTVEVVVTDLVKTVDGVPNVVVWERDFTEGELVEAELALFAQDKAGNIWHMGEYPEEYEEGRLVATPAWFHGLEGATAGITIPAAPEEGTPDYAQGFAPKPINWVDRGRVYDTGVRTCVPAGCYRDVVVIEEFETGLPDAFQDKFYAPGVGVVRVGWRGSKDESKEVLELVRVGTLTPAELADARAAALRLEDRAYRTSKVYRQTEPAVRATAG